jgi:hypothetical protein
LAITKLAVTKERNLGKKAGLTASAKHYKKAESTN